MFRIRLSQLKVVEKCMFRRGLSQLKVVEYRYNPALEGKADIAAGVLGLAVTAVMYAAGMFNSWIFLVISSVLYAGVMAWGVYLWRLRRKPMKREITLGGIKHRLYLRSRPLFIIYCLAVKIVDWLIVISVLAMLESDAGWASAFLEELYAWTFILPLALYAVIIEYLTYLQFYRTPENMRSIYLSGDGNTDLYTEALRQMGKDGKERE